MFDTLLIGMPDYSYRKKLWVDTNPNNGEVTLRCVATDIVRIRPNGEIILTTGGYFTVCRGHGLVGSWWCAWLCRAPRLSICCWCVVGEAWPPFCYSLKLIHAVCFAASKASKIVLPAVCSLHHVCTHCSQPLHPALSSAQATTLNCMNDILSAIDCEIDANGRVPAGNWTVYDNHGAEYRYQDNMVIPATDPRDSQRGRIAMAAVQRELKLGGIVWNGRGGHNAPGKLPPPPVTPAAAASRPAAAARPLAATAAPWVPPQASTAPSASASGQASGVPQATVAFTAAVPARSAGGRPPPPGFDRGPAPAPAPAQAAPPATGAWGAGMSAAERLKHAQSAQQHRKALHEQQQQHQQAAPEPRKTVEEQLAEQARRLDLASGGEHEHMDEDQL